MRAEIQIRLRADILDPQGQAVESALRAEQHNHVRSVRVGKLIELELGETLSREAALESVTKMCEDLLANPIMEDYSITLIE